jgi:hypothetical protein
MKHLFALLFLTFFSLSCTESTALEPLDATRQKLAEVTSVAFELEMIWNNTFIGDTMVMPTHKGVYIRNKREGFSYDFLYEAGEDACLYRNGRLEDIDQEKGRIVTYTEDESKENLAYEGNFTSMMTPMEVVKDSAWTRTGHEGNIVYYDKILNDNEDESGHAYTFARLHIDSTKSEIVLQEQFYTLNGEPQQHIQQHYSGFAFNQHDSLNYLYPEGLKSIANADVEKQKENEGLEPGDTFPVFDLVDVEGTAYSSESVRGKKLAFVFSFIGCGGCEYARKELAKSEFEFSDDYLAFYLNPANPAEQIVNYHLSKPWPFKMASIDYDFSKRYGVYLYPTFITVDEAGRVEEVVEGYEASFFEGKGK